MKNITITTLAICAVCALVPMVAVSAADHGHDHDHDHGAPNLGSTTIAGATLAVSAHGTVTAGGEAGLEIHVTKGQAPAELRAWIGVANGRGSVKALLRPDDHGHYHAHLEVPAELPENSAVWFGAVDAEGNRQRANVPLPELGKDYGGHGHEGHKHDHGHEGHDHEH